MVKKSNEVNSVHVHKCAVMHALEIIGGKWRLPIIWELSAQKSMRYNELKRHLNGITNIMLTRALQGLEEHHLVNRIAHNQIPPHVEYSLTESCREILPALEIINQWGKRQMLNDSCEEKSVNYSQKVITMQAE
ncbi:winged helix-turn-helix transcriptional regulator [Propionispira raffinosivorans]|uniref:winged helix-turn-helix transcriptional regulator n=1 Tax=Propionispira raffinosivorans TaxID=86959 RepID=UPI0003792C15|nr:helix-turn-helix domain-containing protein [Propionispira raffinosivorans]